MAETIQQQLQQLVLLPETQSTSSSAAAVEGWHAGGFGANKGHNDEIMEQLGPIILSVYRAKKEELFKKQVEIFVAKKDAEIMKLCGDHHKQFAVALEQLLKIKQNTSTLREKIVELNTDLQNSGKDLVSTKKELLVLKNKHRNVELALAATKKCTEVFHMVANFEQQVQNKTYYEAIKTLEDLQQAYIQKVKNYKIGRVLSDSFGVMSAELKDAALSDMREWLYGLKKTMRQIGAQYDDRMNRKQLNWVGRIKGDKDKYVSPAVHFVLDEEFEEPEQSKIDLKPLYLCLYVHIKLGYKAEFVKSYSKDRKAQIDLIMNSTGNVVTQDLTSFDNLIYDVIGFFIIENNVVTSSPDFRAKTDVDLLWDSVVNSFSTIIAKNIQAILSNEKTASSIKKKLETFTFVMEEYSYDVQKLRELIVAIFNT